MQWWRSIVTVLSGLWLWGRCEWRRGGKVGRFAMVTCHDGVSNGGAVSSEWVVFARTSEGEEEEKPIVA